MPISKETIERIRKEAFDAYSDVFDSSADDLERGYVHGAEAEAERAQPVIEALEHLINDVRRKPNDARYTTALNKATEVLANYNSKPVK